MRVEISCQNRVGLVQDVLDVLVQMNVDLRGVDLNGQSNEIFLRFPDIAFAELQQIMPRIRMIDGVNDVKTTAYMPIEREQNQYIALFQSLPEPIFSLDTKGRILSLNHAASARLGLGEEEIFGREITDFISPFDLSILASSQFSDYEETTVKFELDHYLANLHPVTVKTEECEETLAGAMLILRSQHSVGRQISSLNTANSNSLERIVAVSASMRQVIRRAKRAARQDLPIFLYGESGAGKEMLALACHNASSRNGSECLIFNCGSSSPEQTDVTLFGSEALDFQSEGLLEKANGGTLILKSVDLLPKVIQKKLLQFIEQGTFFRSGGKTIVSADVRLVSTSNVDVGLMVQRGSFSSALFHSLNVLGMIIPALRDRKSDILPLAECFIKQYAMLLAKPVPRLSEDFKNYLLEYLWPGNIKQLKHAIHRALVVQDTKKLTKSDIQVPSSSLVNNVVMEDEEINLEEAVREFERNILERLYPQHPSTRQLAKRLGLSHTAIANKLKEYGINKQSAIS
jgi:transcriptional regulator of aroF, aroG, tyrA and aromatic amino acid transport